MQDLKNRIRREEHENNRYEADVTRLRSAPSASASSQHASSSGAASQSFRSDLVHSADLDTVLMLFKQAIEENEREQSHTECYEFYFSCLDRIDVLVTEKGSSVSRKEVFRILRSLAHFKPKEFEKSENINKAMGYVSQK